MNTKNIIVIDGKELLFENGETILSVAKRNDIAIPTLCHLKGSTPTGACRICVVEVDGARSLMASCTVPATPNMVVRTESALVVKARKMVIELMLTSGNHEDCLVCPSSGDCTLQELAYRYQVRAGRFPKTSTRYNLEAVNPFIVRNFSKCLLCGKCVQACKDVQVNNAIDFGYRGSDTKIIAQGDMALKDSDCVFCGECVQACPVGALIPKDAYKKPRICDTHTVKSTCTYCGVGCQINLHTHKNKVQHISGNTEVGPNYGSLCVKGRYGFDFISSPERLKTPLIKENGSFREASWDEALTLVADRLTAIKNTSGPDSI
ncbi:MAG: (2Fe-2S)-binding protein, partial [Proteobacteria bacterium]|nr:(2Fe-2S)-binding protein [Pseudomonadota bacterium]